MLIFDRGIFVNQKNLIKKSFLLLSFVSLSNNVFAGESIIRNGLYVGVTADYSITETDVSLNQSGSTTAGSYDIKGGNFGVIAGHKYTVGERFFITPEVGASISEANGSINFGGNGYETDKKYSINLNIKPGFNITDRLSAYAIAGWKFSKYSAERVNGVNYGAGFDIALTQRVSTAFEFERTNYRDKEYVYGPNDTETVSLDENTFKTALKFHF